MSRINEIGEDAEVASVREIGRGLYFVHWKDSSGGLYDKDFNSVSRRLMDFDFITEFTELGDLDGRKYYGFIGRDYSHYHDGEFRMFDDLGRRVMFKHMEYNYPDTMAKLKENFGKLQHLSQVYKSQKSIHRASEQLMTEAKRITLRFHR